MRCRLCGETGSRDANSTDLRGLLARLTFETRLLRYGRQLARKDWVGSAACPGRPARTAADGCLGVGAAPAEDPVTTGSLATDDGNVVTEDGSHVLSIRIRARPRPFDEQHFVTAPDGERRIFETSGSNQTIRDGETGEVLARSTFTAQGAEPEAWVQPALLRTLAPAAAVLARTMEAAASLFAALSARNDRNGTAALGLTATGFLPRASPDFDTTWVGRLSREKLDAACPRAAEVKAIADEAAAYVRSQIEGLSPQEFGSRVHLRIKDQINSQRDPKFVAEISLSRTGELKSFIWHAKHVSLLDVLEQARLRYSLCLRS